MGGRISGGGGAGGRAHGGVSLSVAAAGARRGDQPDHVDRPRFLDTRRLSQGRGMKGFLQSRKALTLGSLVFTYLFFFEYLPPVRWVYIVNDLIVFHYPLADYAFQRLRQGHLPFWDPTIYCGMSFVSNVQAALFYPPTWVMFAFNLGRERLSYQSMQDLVLAHVWMGFLMAYLWLHGKRLGGLSCVLGAGVFAVSGYLCSRLLHFVQVAGYVWMPLALWGVDQAVERRSWRPMWKIATA